MGSTFKCWLIANFEITLFLFTTIVGSIFFFAFGNGGEPEKLKIFFWGGLLVLALNAPTKSGLFQYGKYVAMLVLVILAMIGGWGTDSIEGAGTNWFFWIFWILFAIASVIAGLLAYYAYNNFDEVVSRRMLYWNSNVSLFDIQWKYTLDRFCNISVSIITCIPWFVLLILGTFS